MPHPDNFNSAAYLEKWGADTGNEAERLFLGAAMRTSGAKLVEALRTADTDDKLFNARCHELAQEFDEKMAELMRWGDL